MAPEPAATSAAAASGSADERSLPAPGKYRHYKGMVCEVIGVARHSETLEEMVVYREWGNPDFGDSIWVRPKVMFLETVEVDGKRVPRFTRVD